MVGSAPVAALVVLGVSDPATVHSLIATDPGRIILVVATVLEAGGMLSIRYIVRREI